MTPKRAYKLLGKYPNYPDKNKLENLIAQSAKYSYLHAFFNQIRFIEGESAIAKNPFYSFYYSKKIIKKRFIEGEEVMVKCNSNNYLPETNL